MSTILSRVRDVDPNDSEAIKDALGAFFQSLPKYKDVGCTQWLRALEDVINRFPKYCGTHRPAIESFLTHFLNSNNYYNVSEAAKCAHAVQQVRPAQDKAATPKACWRELMAILCEAAHKLIDALFTKNTSRYGKQKKKKVQQPTPSSTLQQALIEIDSFSGYLIDTDYNKTDVLCTRLRNVLVFIQAMLVEIYPVGKPVQPQLILQVILQALSSSGSADSSTVTTVKTQALRTLDAMVACLGSNLIPFSALIFRFVMQTLKWSSDNPSEESRKVRIQAYSSLSQWLDVLHVFRPCVEARALAWHVDLTNHICADATPVRHTVQLTVNASHPMKNLSKKARKRLANTMLRESSMASHMPGEKNKCNLSAKSNDEVAIAALKCAETFLSVCGIFLDTAAHKARGSCPVNNIPPIKLYGAPLNKVREFKYLGHLLTSDLKDDADIERERRALSVRANMIARRFARCSREQFQELLVGECFSMSSYSTERSMCLLQALEADRKNCSTRVPPPTQYCLQLYSELINSPMREISKFCSTALLDIRLHLHCSPASLNFAIEQQPLKKDKDDGRKMVSEQNRAALQKLLGADWTNSEASSEAIITIPDEPVAKRPRGEDDNDDQKITENVSISSESIHSVEENSDVDDVIIEVVEPGDKPFVNEKDQHALSLIVAEIHEEPTKFATKADEAEMVKQTTDEPLTQIDPLSTDIQNLTIHSEITQMPSISVEDDNETETGNDDVEVEKLMKTLSSESDINEAKTQLLQDSDAIDGKSPSSMEVAYDYPNTGKGDVKALDKMDDENLPSTNDTDDIQITCGQVVKNSQELSAEKKDGDIESPKGNIVPKVNGIKNVDTMNGDATGDEEATIKKVPSDKTVTVEDMLADFVDEVNEETQA